MILVMSVRKKNTSERRYRCLYTRFEKKKNLYRFAIECSKFNILKKYSFGLVLYKIPKKASLTFIRNRCVITGKGSGVLSDFRISRHMFKKLVNAGKIYSIKKDL